MSNLVLSVKSIKGSISKLVSEGVVTNKEADNQILGVVGVTKTLLSSAPLTTGS